jgi:hypothetical protein
MFLALLEFYMLELRNYFEAEQYGKYYYDRS